MRAVTPAPLEDRNRPMSVLLQVKKKKIGRQLTDAGKYTRKEATQSKKSLLQSFLEDTSSSKHKPIILFYFILFPP